MLSFKESKINYFDFSILFKREIPKIKDKTPISIKYIIPLSFINESQNSEYEILSNNPHIRCKMKSPKNINIVDSKNIFSIYYSL